MTFDHHIVCARNNQRKGSIKVTDTSTIQPTKSAYQSGIGGVTQLLNDIEGIRIASDNRLRSLTRDEPDKDGVIRGAKLDESDPTVAVLAKYADEMNKMEERLIRDLQKQMRAHPLAGWVKREKGVGEKQAARLLEAVGDPYWNSLHSRPRTVSELWAYCGYSVKEGAAQRRKKGEKSNWSSEAKMRAFLMAESCIKTKGRYRDVYDDARAQYENAVHPTDCVRCGPAGKPALAGSPLSAGHQHARALRRVAKEILKDLWTEAKAVHEAE